MPEVRLGRQVTANRPDADLGAVRVLTRNILERAGVLPHQQGSQTGFDSPLPQRRHAIAQFVLQCGGHRLAVEFGGHVYAP